MVTQRTAAAPKAGTGMVKKAAGDEESAGLIEQVGARHCSTQLSAGLLCSCRQQGSRQRGGSYLGAGSSSEVT